MGLIHHARVCDPRQHPHRPPDPDVVATAKRRGAELRAMRVDPAHKDACTFLDGLKIFDPATCAAARHAFIRTMQGGTP